MKKLTLLILLVFNSPTFAEEAVDSKPMHPVAKFFLIEGLLLFNSYVTAAAPQEWGTLLTLLSPLGASESASDTTNAVGIAGAAALGLYNALELKDEEKYSKSEVLKKNLIGWHVILGSIYLSEKATGNNNTKAYLSPTHDGAILAINHRF